MTRTVYCLKLKKELEGLDELPFPGKLGQKIYENISKQAWEEWMHYQTRLINEYRLNLLDSKAKEFVLTEIQEQLFGQETSTEHKDK